MTGTSLLTLLLTISVYPYTVLSLVAESSGSLSNHFCLVRRESYRKKRQNTFVVHLSNHEDENTREKESVEKFRSKLEHIYDSEIDYCAEFMKSHPNGVGWHESCAEENEVRTSNNCDFFFSRSTVLDYICSISISYQIQIILPSTYLSFF